MNQCNDPDHGAINAERNESRGLRKAWLELDDKRQVLERQRDKLAEALESIIGESAFEGIPESKQQSIYEALQFLNQPEP